MFFPLDALPKYLAMIGGALPSTEMVRLLRMVLLYGVTEVPDLAGGLLRMSAWAFLFFAISLRSFKWHG